MEKVRADSHPEQSLEVLQLEHEELDERVTQLERKAWLSQEEDVELARLKKMKLQKKDRIERMIAAGPSASV